MDSVYHSSVVLMFDWGLYISEEATFYSYPPVDTIWRRIVALPEKRYFDRFLPGEIKIQSGTSKQAPGIHW